MGAGWSFAVVAALTWGAAGFLAGQAARRGAMSAVLLATQAAGLLTMLLVTAGRSVTGNGIDVDQWLAVLPWAALAGSAELLGFAALYRAMKRGPMGIAAPVAGLGVVVPVLVGLTTGNSLGGWQLTGLVVAALGIVLLTRNTGPFGGGNVGTAALSGVSFGVALVALAQGAQLDEVASGTLMRAVTVPVVLIAWWLRPRRIGRHALVDAEFVLGTGRIEHLPAVILALLAGVFDALGNLAFAMSSTRTSLTVAALIGSMDPVVTAVLARLFIAEQLHRAGRWGVVAAVLGAALISGA